MDYYSYKPLVTLDRPVVLTGLPGTNVVAITRMVGSFTGLPVLLVERKLSHALEHHPDRLTAEGRHVERWNLEKRMLEAAFSATRTLVAMPSQSLLRMGALGWLSGRARVVFVAEPSDRVFDRVAREVGEDPTRHWLLHRGQPLDRASVSRELSAHRGVLGGCEQVVVPERVESHAVAREVIEALGLSATA